MYINDNLINYVDIPHPNCLSCLMQLSVTQFSCTTLMTSSMSSAECSPTDSWGSGGDKALNDHCPKRPTLTRPKYKMLQADGNSHDCKRLTSLQVLNANEATHSDDLRSNNTHEGWNNTVLLFWLLRYCHPSVWKTMMWFQKEQSPVQTARQQ